MINFCHLQIPYQQYNLALEKYYNNELETAAELLKKIYYKHAKIKHLCRKYF